MKRILTVTAAAFALAAGAVESAAEVPRGAEAAGGANGAEPAPVPRNYARQPDALTPEGELGGAAETPRGAEAAGGANGAEPAPMPRNYARQPDALTPEGALGGAAETPRERAARNLRLVDRYQDSVAVVRYYLKSDERGREPNFKVRYKCPNCESNHFRDIGASAAEGIPAIFTGFVVAPDRVVMSDVFIPPGFIDRIEVECAGERVAAEEFEASVENQALALKTKTPFTKARPIKFAKAAAPARPEYFYIVRDDGATCAGIRDSAVASFSRTLETGKDLYKGDPNTIVLNEEGAAASLNFLETLAIGEENFNPPGEWRWEKASARFERLRTVEEEVAKSILPVNVHLEAEKKDGGFISRRFAFSSDSESDDTDTVVILVEDKAIIPVSLAPAATARLQEIKATLPDGSKAALEFVGSYADYGLMAVRFKEGVPAGVKPLKLDRESVFAHVGEALDILKIINRSGRLDFCSGLTYIESVKLAKGERVVIDDVKTYGLATESSRDKNRGVAILSKRGLISFSVSGRKNESYSDRPLSCAELAAAIDEPQFDAENVPRKGEDRKRVPYFGVEAQKASADVLKEKRAYSYFDRDYERQSAAVVVEVAPESPAARLGIKAGDVLLSMQYPGGGKVRLDVASSIDVDEDWNKIIADDRFLEIGGDSELTPWPNVEGGVNANIIKNFSVGAEVVVAWVSDGERKEGRTTLTLAPVHYKTAPRARSKALGMTVCDMTAEVRKYFKFDDSAPGVVVSKIKSGSVAAVAGVRPLELVTEVDGEEIHSAKEFAEKIKGKQTFELKVRRFAATRIVPVKL